MKAVLSLAKSYMFPRTSHKVQGQPVVQTEVAVALVTEVVVEKVIPTLPPNLLLLPMPPRRANPKLELVTASSKNIVLNAVHPNGVLAIRRILRLNIARLRQLKMPQFILLPPQLQHLLQLQQRSMFWLHQLFHQWK